MRIAYVCTDPGVPVFGQKGCSIHVQEMIRAFLRRGAQVELFAVRFDGAPPAGMEQVRLHQLPALPKGDQQTRERAALHGNRALQAALAAAGRFDLVYERYALWSFAAQEYAQATGTPSVLEVNAPLIEEQATYRGLVDIAGATQATIRCFQAARIISAVSHEVAAYVGTLVAAHKVHVIPNGVDPGRFPDGMAAALPAPKGVFTVGFVGTLKPWHGLPTLIAAYELLARRGHMLRLLVVGDGPERPALEAQLAEYGLSESVHFTGSVAPQVVPGLLASMDVAVAPYPAFEPFYFSPLKLYEYMAAGLPTVASRIGQIERVLQHNKTGLLYTPGDAAALAATLERLQREPMLRRLLGQAARNQVRQHHTWDAVAGTVLAHATVGQKPGRARRDATPRVNL